MKNLGKEINFEYNNLNKELILELTDLSQNLYLKKESLQKRKIPYSDKWWKRLEGLRKLELENATIYNLYRNNKARKKYYDSEESKEFIFDVNIQNDIIFFTTSKYIGDYSENKLAIKIIPRFGNEWFNKILHSAFNFYCFDDLRKIQYGGKNGSILLIALIWIVLARESFNFGLFRNYSYTEANIYGFKGHININKQIKHNTVNKALTYCNYWKLSTDNKLNRMLLWVANDLSNTKELGVSNINSEIKKFVEEMILAGIELKYDEDWLINYFNFSNLNNRFQDLYNISLIYLKNNFGQHINNKDNSITFFLDVSELWELFTEKWLKLHFKLGYKILNLNKNYDLSIYLLKNKMNVQQNSLNDNKMFRLIPDLLIYKNDSLIGIIDAKYKWTNDYEYKHFGIYREDIYQLTSYLTAFSNKYGKINFGSLIYPINNDDIWKGENFYSLKINSNDVDVSFQRVNPTNPKSFNLLKV